MPSSDAWLKRERESRERAPAALSAATEKLAQMSF